VGAIMLYDATVMHAQREIQLTGWQFVITTKTLAYHIVAESWDHMEEWMEAIKKNIAAPLTCKWSSQVHDNLAITCLD